MAIVPLFRFQKICHFVQRTYHGVRRMSKKKQNDMIIRKEKPVESEKNVKMRQRFRLIFEILATLAFSALVAVLMFQSVTMQESSMEPTLSVGNRYFMNRIVYRISEPERGDIIVFRTNASDEAALHIRRVIGLPGETIQIVDGQILINGETYKEGKDFPVISNPGLAAKPISLGSGEYFVLGDNRNNSEDSRYGDIGIVNKKYISGKLWFSCYPLNNIGFLES